MKVMIILISQVIINGDAVELDVKGVEGNEGDVETHLWWALAVLVFVEENVLLVVEFVDLENY